MPTPQDQKSQENQDEFVALEQELGRHIARLKSKPPKDVEELAAELSGTALDFVRDVLALQIRLRAWAFEQFTNMQDAIGELGERLEPENSALLPEDAEKFLALAQGTRHLIDRTLEAHPPANVRATLEELRRLADDCEKIATESVIEEDDEDETEGDEEEDDEEDDEERDEDKAALPPALVLP